MAATPLEPARPGPSAEQSELRRLRRRSQVADDLACVMADEVYFHQRDLRAVAEPESMAMLHVGHWQGSSGLDRGVWLEEYTSLELLRSALWAARDRATRVEGPGRCLSADKVHAAQADADRYEQAFFVAVDLGDRLWDLCQPVNPSTGGLWTDGELRVPKRSSSGVESLNRRLRVLQMVHRTVSDEMLGLVALAWNLTPRRHGGWHRGESPYDILAVDLGRADKPWTDVLLDAQESHSAAA